MPAMALYIRDEDVSGGGPRRRKNTVGFVLAPGAIMSALTLSWFSFVLYFYFLIHSTFQGNAVSGSTRGARGAMSRRDTGLYALGERTHRPAKVPSLLVASLDELSAGLEAGEFTSVDLTRAYIERINEVNPTLHAVTEINPDAIAIAKELDLERRLGKTRGYAHIAVF